MIDLDSTSSTPPYEQIRSQVAAQLDSGALQPGDRLPTVRRLAEDQVQRKARAAASAHLAETKALGLSGAEAVALVRMLDDAPLHG